MIIKGDEMDEKEFVKEISLKIRKDLEGYEIGVGKYLLYKIFINENYEVCPKETMNPKKNNYAFQTDMLITKRDMPLVVVEAKYDKLSTHDVLIYSTKAIRHKEIYPYIRYGLLFGKSENIPNRFFMNNYGFDFAVTIKDINNQYEIDKLVKVLKNQIKSSEAIIENLRKDYKPNIFSSTVEITK